MSKCPIAQYAKPCHLSGDIIVPGHTYCLLALVISPELNLIWMYDGRTDRFSRPRSVCRSVDYTRVLLFIPVFGEAAQLKDLLLTRCVTSFSNRYSIFISLSLGCCRIICLHIILPQTSFGSSFPLLLNPCLNLSLTPDKSGTDSILYMLQCKFKIYSY